MTTDVTRIQLIQIISMSLARILSLPLTTLGISVDILRFPCHGMTLQFLFHTFINIGIGAVDLTLGTNPLVTIIITLRTTIDLAADVISQRSLVDRTFVMLPDSVSAGNLAHNIGFGDELFVDGIQVERKPRVIVHK